MDSPLSPASDPRLGRTPCFEPEAELVGVVLEGRYKVRRRIASGGMATVYLAKDEALRCHVAIKVLRRRDADAARRFTVEAEVLSNVRDDHLVRVLGSGRTPDDRPYLVLEHLAGETLGGRLARRGPLPWREVVQIGAQIAGALAALHAAGVIHRDVKPYNAILVATTGGEIVVKLIDLGLARVSDVFQQAQDEAFTPVLPRHRTELGRTIGTPEYLPPEAGEREADVGFDIYALATTLYQLCTGMFPRGTGMQPLHVARPQCDAPADLSRLLLAALAADPSERLPSAEQFARGLEGTLAAHPETTTPANLIGGCYDRLELLGVGRSAAVFRASDRWLSREVALKVMRREHPREDDRLRFRLAAKILSALHHPNIAGIYHAGIADGQMFVATELRPGVPATDLTTPASRLRPDEVISAGLQLADALASVHVIGVVYRDLHPGNVLIDRGPALKVSLFDFDAAEVSPEFHAHLNERYATPPERRRHPARDIDLRRADYVAPEVRAGGPYTAASDVFALGLLLYRLLTGARPFGPHGGDLKPARECCACPEALDMLLTRMLSPDPAIRPMLWQVEGDLKDARHELEGAVQVAATRQGDAPTPVVAPPAAGRSRVAALLLAVAVLGLAVGLVLGRLSMSVEPAELASSADVVVPPAEVQPPSVTPDAEPGELCEPDPEPAPISSPPAEPAVSGASAPVLHQAARRPVRRAAAPARREPLTHAEAEAAAQPALVAMRACPGVPSVVVADLTVTRGRGTVRLFNGHPLSDDVGWHACVQRAVEAAAYPASDATSHVRVRLKIR